MNPLAMAMMREAQSTAVLGLTWRAGVVRQHSVATWQDAVRVRLMAFLGDAVEELYYQLPDTNSREEEMAALQWARQAGKDLSFSILTRLNPVSDNGIPTPSMCSATQGEIDPTPPQERA